MTKGLTLFRVSPFMDLLGVPQLSLELLLLTATEGALESLTVLAVLRKTEAGIAFRAADPSGLDVDEHTHCVTPFGW